MSQKHVVFSIDLQMEKDRSIYDMVSLRILDIQYDPYLV
jgi:hypothetical protein